jgi:hypothetical protein
MSAFGGKADIQFWTLAHASKRNSPILGARRATNLEITGPFIDAGTALATKR